MLGRELGARFNLVSYFPYQSGSFQLVHRAIVKFNMKCLESVVSVVLSVIVMLCYCAVVLLGCCVIGMLCYCAVVLL